jgi:hypothetical protein
MATTGSKRRNSTSENPKLLRPASVSSTLVLGEFRLLPIRMLRVTGKRHAIRRLHLNSDSSRLQIAAMFG